MPNRSMSSTHRVKIGPEGREHTYYITLGYMPLESRVIVNECSVKHGKDGTELDNLVADVSNMISCLLQTGFPIADLLDTMTRLSDFQSPNLQPSMASHESDFKPASILGAIVKYIKDEQDLLNQIHSEDLDRINDMQKGD